MKYQWASGFKKGAVASAVAGVLLGVGVIAAPAFAITSTPTGTIMGRAPTLTAGEIVWTDNSGTGVVDVDDELSIDPAKNFVFDDVDGDESTGETYEWLRDGTPIAGETGNTYTITAADLGKSISLRATPNTDPLTTVPSTGNPVDSNAIAVKAAGFVYAASINGTPGVDVELAAVAQCVTGACDLNNLEYQWQIEGRDPTTGSGTDTFVNISGANGDKFTPTKDMQRLRLQVIITNK